MSIRKPSTQDRGLPADAQAASAPARGGLDGCEGPGDGPGEGGEVAQVSAQLGSQVGSQVGDVLSRVAACLGLRAQGPRLEALGPLLQSRLRSLVLPSLPLYAARLEQDAGLRRQEMPAIARALTTGETFFFRDAGQMGLLRQTVLPALRARAERAGRATLRVWSCACATGEEAYSLALLMHTLWPDAAPGAFEVLGTDIDTQALSRARAGEYGAWSFRGFDETLRSRWFHQVGPNWRLDERIRRAVHFDTLDLVHDPLPDPGRRLHEIDLIVCRNLFIYLTPQAVSAAASALSRCLVQGGVLMAGHGELLHHRPAGLAMEMHEPSMLYRRDRALDGAPASASGSASSSASASASASACATATAILPALPQRGATRAPTAPRRTGLARRVLRKPLWGAR